MSPTAILTGGVFINCTKARTLFALLSSNVPGMVSKMCSYSFGAKGRVGGSSAWPQLLLFVFGSGGLSFKLGFQLAPLFLSYGPGACGRLASELLISAGVFWVWGSPTEVLAAVAFPVKLFVVILAICAVPYKDRDTRSRAHRGPLSERHG